ncbi:hypothetical protein [Stakelama marina]|uniref:Response regulatory domain-containing protein n=1 Tax=Stakelama marina TaxID=2826939 RepID=A0A8T4IAB4_9SPHN|nr:hypothetical protein [Stakelama marina]MBR0551301.1 hypothetical protein [Stakelama marina]
MSHALVIDGNREVSRVITDQLCALGFKSIAHAWTEEEAVEAADIREPDLVVVGDQIIEGSAIDAGRRIAQRHDVPMLLVTGDAARVKKSLPAGAHIDGPFKMDAMRDAVERSRQVGSNDSF